MGRFTKILQTETDANLDRFNKGTNPTLMLVVYTRKKQLFQDTAIYLSVSIYEETMATTSTKHAVATGGIEVAWRK